MPTLSIDIEARLAKFQDGLDRVARDAGRSARQIEGAFSGLKSTLAGLGAGVTFGAIAGAIKQTILDIGDLNDAAAEAGISVESLSSLLNTLKPTGVGLPEIVDLTGKIVRAMQQAESATSAQAAAFKALGVATRDSAGNLRGADDVLSDVAAAMSRYQDDANKVAIAQALLSKTGASYLPVLGDLASRQREAASITKEQAQAADDLADQVRELGVQYDILKQKIVGSFLHELLAALERFNKLNELAGLNIVKRIQIQGFGPAGDAASDLEENARAIEKSQASIDRIRASIEQASSRQSEGFFSDLVNRGDLAILRRNLADAEAGLKALKDRRQYLELVKRQSDPRQPAGPDTRPGAPAIPGAGGAGTAGRTASEAARAFEDFESRVNAAVSRLFENTPIAKARELEAVLLRLDQLFQSGIDPDIYGQAVGETLVGLVQSGKSASDALAELDKRFFDGKISAEAYDAALAKIYRTTATAGRDGQAALEELANKWRDLADPTREYLRELEEVRRLHADGKLTDIEAQRSLADIQRRATAGLQGTNEALADQKNLANDLGLTFTSAFEDAIVAGDGLRDVLAGLEQDILRIVTRRLVTEPLGNAITNLLGSAIGGIRFGPDAPIVASVPTTIFPNRASGGPVSSGMPYIVGETGPELFVPHVNGDIVPRADGGPTVNMTVYTRDAESFRRSEGQVVSRLSGALARSGRFA